MSSNINALVVALAQPATRAEAARTAAQAVGCEELAFFVRDPALGILVPAPAMPKTFAGGPRWREFLNTCGADGRHEGEVDLPRDRLRRAVALSGNGAVALLLGGAPAESALETLHAQMPMFGALLQAEHRWQLGQAEIREARLAADRAHALVKALDAARASSAVLNDQLRREHARKDEFLAMLAHELRNPLAPLSNSLTILRRLQPSDVGLARRQFDIMGRQVSHLARLVDDLLDVSRVSRGLIELRREKMLLAEVIEDALDTIRPAAQLKRHRLQVFADTESVHVYADRVRLTQIFSNLFQNAVKYTDPGGLISIGTVADGARVSVIVRDTGVGIPKDMLSRVFDLFEQVPMSEHRSEGGLGIGLTLVRTLTELHGGHVTAHSVGLGQGSTFTVSLPTIALGSQEPARLAERTPPMRS